MQKSKNVLLLFPKFQDGFVMGKVPLGLAYIASYLEKHGHYVEAYNLVVDKMAQIDFAKFDYVGITCLTAFISHVRTLADHIREKNPKIKIIVGGPHPSMKMKDTLEITKNIDFVIAGEGETPMLQLVESKDPKSEKIPGVYFWNTEDVMVGEPYKPVNNLDELPYPNQRMFDHGNLEKQNPFRSIQASRGCPFGCFNCQPYLRKLFSFRLRSPQSVVDEMTFLQKEYGQNYFGFVDSEFPISKKWFLEFVDLIEKNKLDMKFHCNAFSKLIDEEILEGYKRMNITRLAIGVESGNQYVVDEVLNKRINLEYTKKVFELAAKHGINTHAYFMIGIPGESLENMQETMDYAVNLAANTLEFNILTPWPGTRFYELAQEKGWLIEDYRYEDYNEKRAAVISTDKWTNEDVLNMHKKVTNTFLNNGWTVADDGTVFFRPGQKMPSKEEIQEIRTQFHLDV